MPSFFKPIHGGFPLFRLATLSLILFLGYGSQLLSLLPTSWTFNILLLYILYTFHLTCVTDPGCVSDKYIPPEGQMRWCLKCNDLKPPRTHHCRSCGRCVLRMDHHCPWLDSCVGFNNHADFMRFMISVVPLSGYLSKMMFQRIYNDYLAEILDQKTMIMAGILGIVSSTVCFAVFCLLAYQVWYISGNLTTIESWTKSKLDRTIYKHDLPDVEYPYDLQDFTLNIKQIFGDNILFWFWPGVQGSGDGHSFPVNEDCDPSTPWPPKLNIPSPKTKSAKSKHTKTKDTKKEKRDLSTVPDDELSFEDYAALGLIDDSDSEDETLADYGADDRETTHLNHIIDSKKTTIAMIIKKRKAG